MTVASLTYDDRGRLWVATERDRAHFSYFDIYVGIEYVGSVRVRDRLLGYDLYGSTLVTIVEREPDADGIGWHAADWYDIAGLTLARISHTVTAEGFGGSVGAEFLPREQVEQEQAALRPCFRGARVAGTAA